MSHVFISYKREDHDTAEKVRLALRAELKCDVWWDQDLQTGGQWNEAIDDALSSASCVVVLWSTQSVQSPWVQQEAAVAKALGILAPALIDDCEVPTPYAGIQAARLINWQGHEKDAEFANLATGVNACLAQRLRRRINRMGWLLGSLLVGLLAGFGAQATISKNAQVETIKPLEAKIESLKKENAALETKLANYLDPNERVLFYKAQILSLRGDIEGRSNSILDDLHRERGLHLAGMIGRIDEGQLKPAKKIIQHEYRGWAYLMGVSTYGEIPGETPPEYMTAESRIDYATKAVAEFDLALDLMADITRDYRAGEPAASRIYEWMTGPSEDVNRTHHLKAIALAVIARAGGRTPQAAIDELSAIKSPTYLATFPPKDNPDLAWALQQSSSTLE